MTLLPGIRSEHFRHQIVIPVLTRLAMHSPHAENLMMGTAAIESRMGSALVQVGGPAVGVFQMEPSTHDSLWDNYLHFLEVRSMDVRHMLRWSYDIPPPADLMITDLKYATAMARIKYWRSSFSWPEDPNDIEGLANIWKTHYNTSKGAGTVAKFVLRYKKYVDQR